jgi:hypothetical protein
MAFTETTLNTSSLLETTFISDMRLIVNANNIIVKSKVEDIINTLQIDLVNKYIGVDIPIQQLYTNDAVISNQLLLKSGTSGTSGTIASLTQTAGTSAFLADNINFTKTLTSLAAGSKVLTPSVVIGTTVGNAAVSFPTSGGSGIVDRGLYVGDTTTPISANFYGEVNIKKQAMVQSYNTDFDTVGTVRLLELTSAVTTPTASSALYANLTLSKTDPQFIYINLRTPAAFTLAATNPIYLLLHEDFTTTTSRPVAGQTFTIILNNLLNNSNVEISTSTWPQAQVASGTAAAINIISGFTQTASAGAGALKSGYINGALWPTLPTTVTSAITKLTETSPFLQYVRLYNRNVQAAAIPKPRATSVSFTKTEHSTNFSYYTVTNSNNITIIN